MNPRPLVLASLLAAGVAFTACKKEVKTVVAPVVPVAAYEVKAADHVAYTDFVGQTSAYTSVTLTARVRGTLDQIAFTQGSPVKQNDLLFVIDEKPLKVALDKAKGALEQAKVAVENAQKDLVRIRQLYETGGVSVRDVDTVTLNLATANANMSTAKANVDNAELELGYARIYAPLNGVIGARKVDLGNMVGPGFQSDLADIVQLDPIKVRFNVDERFYLDVIKSRPYKGATDGIFELVLGDGTSHAHRGKLEFVDNKVDAKTGTLMIEVSFPNPELNLRPGLFGRVRFPREVLKNSIAIPQRAVQELQATYSVVVINAENKAEFRQVKVGARIGADWIIKEGLKPGEKIVTDGIQKLRPGSSVAILPPQQPAQK